MLTEKQARAVCEALGIPPDNSRLPATLDLGWFETPEEVKEAAFSHIRKAWQIVQRAAEEAASDG